MERKIMGKKLKPRKTQEESGIGILTILKYLLISYLLTGALLLLLAFLLYRFGLSEKTVSVAIILIYLAATFLAGFLAGRKAASRKFLWGFLQGGIYFLVLLLVSMIVNHSPGDPAHSLLPTLLLCAGGGMLGGMFG